MATTIDNSLPSENMPLSQSSTYGGTTTTLQQVSSTTVNRSSSAPSNDAAPSPTTSPSLPTSGFRLPSCLTVPIEQVLGMIGHIAKSATSLLGFSGEMATRARPWIEFFDLSAFKLIDTANMSAMSTIKAYIQRLRVNAPYFIFNYLLLGLALSVISVITKPIALVGIAILGWIYFQFFGAETRDGDFRFLGFNLDTQGKIGAMVILGLLIFWLTVGGVNILISIFSASTISMLVHGAFRKPSQDASVESAV